MAPNVELSGLRGSSRRSARTQGWATLTATTDGCERSSASRKAALHVHFQRATTAAMFWAQALAAPAPQGNHGAPTPASRQPRRRHPPAPAIAENQKTRATQLHRQTTKGDESAEHDGRPRPLNGKQRTGSDRRKPDEAASAAPSQASPHAPAQTQAHARARPAKVAKAQAGS